MGASTIGSHDYKENIISRDIKGDVALYALAFKYGCHGVINEVILWLRFM
jgi:hypothetical protein